MFCAAIEMIVGEVSVLCCHRDDGGGSKCFILP